MYYQKENQNGIYTLRSRFHENFIVGSHIHEYSEILYCRKGLSEISINRKKLYLTEGEFVFIEPNQIHRYDCVDVDVMCAVFSNDFIPSYFKTTKGKKLTECKFKAEELKGVFEQFPSIDKNDTVLITAYLNLICDKVLKNGTFEKIPSEKGFPYQTIISYLSEHFTEDISLCRLAKTFGYNQKYLSHALYSLTGIRFPDFLASYRIEYAKELLTKSDSSVTEIAMECGFSAVNTFHRQFKKATTMTPCEFKKIYSTTKT